MYFKAYRHRCLTTVVTDVAGDHVSKNQESTGGDFGAPHCSCFFSCSYSYSKGFSIAIRPIGPQVAANCLDQRSASPQFKQPSSTSTVSLSTVRRGGLSTASLSTTKSDARHERKDHRGRGVASPASAMPYPVATSRKQLLGWNTPGPRSARPTGSTASSASGRLRRKVGIVEMIRLADEPWLRWLKATRGPRSYDECAWLCEARTPPITEWPPKWFLKLSVADRPLRCMVLFWLFFVLVLVLVLVLDRASNCIIPSWSTRCSGGNSVMDRLTEVRSMIRESGNGGLWAVTEVALMPWTAKRSITITSSVRHGGLSTGFLFPS